MWDRLVEVFASYGVVMAILMIGAITDQLGKDDPKEALFTMGVGWGGFAALIGVPYVLLGGTIFN